MTVADQARLFELIQHPSAGSKIEAAKRYGVDLTLTLESLRRTPTERVSKMQAALRLVEELERSSQTSQK